MKLYIASFDYDYVTVWGTVGHYHHDLHNIYASREDAVDMAYFLMGTPIMYGEESRNHVSVDVIEKNFVPNVSNLF